MEPNQTQKEETGAAAGHPESPKGAEGRAPAPTPASATAAAPPGIPPILLEGDELPVSPVAGPGQKFELGPEPSPEPLESEEGELPETYGTGRLLLAARDPRCLYAHWDPTAEEQHCYRDQPGHAQLVVRVYLDSPTGRPVMELPVHPESRYWFIPVEQGGATYVAELGCYGAGQDWYSLAVSETVTTPREKVAEEKTVEFATVPLEPAPPPTEEESEVTLPTAAPAPLAGEKAAVSAPVPAPAQPTPLAYAFLPLPPPGPALPGPLQQRPAAPAEAPVPPPTLAEVSLIPQEQGQAPTGLPEVGLPEFVRAHPGQNGLVPKPAPAPPWTPSQEAALTELFGQTFVAAQPQPSSAELAGRLQPLLEKALEKALEQEIPSSLAPALSSPAGGAAAAERRGFWFNLNAELVIYGATEPDAQVTLCGQPIQLRPDGTFSLRFALPDGQFELTAAATSIRGETRSAELKFQRSTHYRGEVGVASQEPGLQPPEKPASR